MKETLKLIDEYRTPPAGTDHSAGLWAPELHCLRGRWYVYYAAANASRGNKSHRMYVLGGPPAGENPCQGEWEFLGRICGTPDQWAIDGTVFELSNVLYFVYSGWPLNNDNDSDLVQELFIVKLEDPITTRGAPVMICRPEHRWEFTRDGNGDHGINEGPQFLSSPDGSWKGLVYSCAGSWTSEYKMATLEVTKGPPPPEQLPNLAKTSMKSQLLIPDVAVHGRKSDGSTVVVQRFGAPGHDQRSDSRPVGSGSWKFPQL